MHLRPQLSSIRSRFGYPYHPWMNQEFDEPGFRLVQKSARQDRFHDVTLLIEGLDGRFALMSKHSYPPGIFRSPSGGVNPGEDIAAGALREAHEETGLKVELKRFLAHITLDIFHEKDVITWDSYIFHATTQDKQLNPIDLKEVRDTTWANPVQMQHMIEKLKGTGNGGLIYRGNLTELSLWALRNKLSFKPVEKFDLLYVEKSLVAHQQSIDDLEKTSWWIAEINGFPAATLGLIARTDCVEMTGLTVEPMHQGRGVGQALAEYVCDLWRTRAERYKLKAFRDYKADEPLWLVTANPGYYLNIDFELMENNQVPQSLRHKAGGPQTYETPMRHQTYRSRVTNL